MTLSTQTEILEEVRGFIEQVIGEEWVSEFDIGMDTAFGADLEVESIEFVALAEKLQDRYGSAIDFPAWFSSMDIDALINLRVGQLVEHIASSLADA